MLCLLQDLMRSLIVWGDDMIEGRDRLGNELVQFLDFRYQARVEGPDASEIGLSPSLPDISSPQIFVFHHVPQPFLTSLHQTMPCFTLGS